MCSVWQVYHAKLNIVAAAAIASQSATMYAQLYSI